MCFFFLCFLDQRDLRLLTHSVPPRRYSDLFPIRNIVPDPLNPTTSPDNQDCGLASKFEILHIRGSVDYKPSDRFGVRLEGDFVKNLGWDRSVLTARAVNNLGPDIQVPNPEKANPEIGRAQCRERVCQSV